MNADAGRCSGVLGAVLAGGESRRMGRDKARVRVEGRPMAARALAVLQGVVRDVVLVAPAREEYDLWGVEIIPDLRPGLGPLSGLHAALTRAGSRSVFLLACDLPFVSEDLIRYLLARPALARLGVQARVPVDGDRTQPLCGLFAADCLPTVKRALDCGQLRVDDLLDQLEVELVEVDRSLSWYRSDLFANINDPWDLANLETNSDMRKQTSPQPDLAIRQSTVSVPVVRRMSGSWHHIADRVTIEEPLEIRVDVEAAGRRRRHSIAVTMRTPGRDRELAAGFLVSEGVVRRRRDILLIEHCRDGSPDESDNVVDVRLAPSVPFEVASLSRNVITSSACGICGRASIGSVQQICSRRPQGDFKLPGELLLGLTRVLAGAQPVFSRTGGLHAAALFDARGGLLAVHEDVGRHNALDKLVGSLFFDRALPASDRIVLVSGRASFELVQKAVLAGIPSLVAVGAPSSLSVELAREYGVTLVGFLRGERFNVYSGSERIEMD